MRRHRVVRAAGARQARGRAGQQHRHLGLSVAGRASLSRPFRILAVGDVVGRQGRDAAEALLPGLRTTLPFDVCIANGENTADGVGITPRLADRLLAAGVDAITLGNHTWRREGIAAYLEGSDRVVRPANMSALMPGRGATVVTTADGVAVAVINVLGSLYLEAASSMWERIDELVEEARRATPIVVVDVHAEATSEKIALAYWLDGKVTAVVGTHTHVQTSDARVSPQGTAAITDLGMTGPHDSVLGVEASLAIRRMRTGAPVRFEVASGGVRLEGALVTCDPETGRASAIEAVRIPWPAP